MSDILYTYIPKFLVNLNRDNEDIIYVSSSYFSPAGDVYTLDKRTISPIVIQTTKSLDEISPEISDVYPFKIVPPLDFDGSTIMLSPSIDSYPTASQNYYAPVYFERYNQSVIRQLDTIFRELGEHGELLSVDLPTEIEDDGPIFTEDLII